MAATSSDSQPRTISNLIVDQTSTNPAAVAAAGFPVRTQGNTGQHPCTTDPDPTANPPSGVPAGCVPTGTDPVHPERHHRRRPVAAVQLDLHLLRPVLRPRRRPDRQEQRHRLRPAEGRRPAAHRRPRRHSRHRRRRSTCDDVHRDLHGPHPGPEPARPGRHPRHDADDIADIDANNTDSPWVDQSQTYTSHASHQVFLREYTLQPRRQAASRPGMLLGGLGRRPDLRQLTRRHDRHLHVGRDQVAGFRRSSACWLQDKDVSNIPMLLTDPYGEFIPGATAPAVPPHGRRATLEGDPTANGGKGVPFRRTLSSSTRRS